MKKKALLIGNNAYLDKAIEPLLAPRPDVERLAVVLQEHGDFDVIKKFDVDLQTAQLHVHELFHDADPEDVLLFYFAGHGISGEDGRLYLALPGTIAAAYKPTSLSSRFVLDEMSGSASDKKIVILDCCHAGIATSPGGFIQRKVKTDPGAIRREFVPEGSGTYVLAACDQSESAFETTDQDTGTNKSVYTSLMIEGITSGDAGGPNETVTISDIHRYVRDRRPGGSLSTEPKMATFDEGDDLELCRNPLVKRPIDPTIVADAKSDNYNTRFGAYHQLKALMDAGGHQATEARQILEARLAPGKDEETHYALRRLIRNFLAPPDAVPPVEEIPADPTPDPGPDDTDIVDAEFVTVEEPRRTMNHALLNRVAYWVGVVVPLIFGAIAMVAILFTMVPGVRSTVENVGDLLGITGGSNDIIQPLPPVLEALPEIGKTPRGNADIRFFVDDATGESLLRSDFALTRGRIVRTWTAANLWSADPISSNIVGRLETGSCAEILATGETSGGTVYISVVPETCPSIPLEAAVPEEPPVVVVMPEDDPDVNGPVRRPDPTEPKVAFNPPVIGVIVKPYSETPGTGQNLGIDYQTAVGAPVWAAAGGQVAAVTENSGANGKIIVVRHEHGMLSVYVNVSDLAVKKGDTVKQGDQLGTVAAATPPILHFEIRNGFESIDPENFF